MAVSTSPRLFSCPVAAPSEDALREAAMLVRAGGLVVFPTETVYGIAVHADNAAAVDRLYRIKGRPADKQLTWHIWDVDQLKHIARDIADSAQQLIDAFWPGPLTLILSGQRMPTIGVRLPDHEVARLFLRLCDVPVVAPSANLSGQPPAFDAAQAIAALGGTVDAVIDSGPTTYRQASTVIDATVSPVRIVREGVITRDRLLSTGILFA